MNVVEKILDKIDPIIAISEGMEFDVVESMYELGFKKSELNSIVSQKTIAQRKADKYINPEESDKIISILNLLKTLMVLFDNDENKALEFLREKKNFLGGKTGMEVIKYQAGINSIIKNANSICYGVYQ